MKAVLMAIHRKWCEKIFRGEKIVEVRKIAPKLETPFKVYVYESLGKKFSCSRCEGCPIRFPLGCNEGAGAVVGEFVCDRVDDYTYDYCDGVDIDDDSLLETCLEWGEINIYANGKKLHGLHITAPKRYDKPKALSEFRKPDEPFHTVEINEKGNVVFCDGYIDGEPITRPPQSFCYVEEIEE